MRPQRLLVENETKQDAKEPVPEPQAKPGFWKFWKKLIPHGRPRFMSEEAARKSGVFVPNWLIALLLLPTIYGLIDFGKSLTRIETKIDGQEARIEKVETQGKLNDEHLRIIQNDVGKAEAKSDIMAKILGQQIEVKKKEE